MLENEQYAKEPTTEQLHIGLTGPSESTSRDGEYLPIQATLAQHDALLHLTHDAITVRDMQDRIVFWNRGAAEQYGWTAEDAHGEVIHTLLQTQFSQPLAEMMHALLQHNLWEGELIHSTRQGARLVVASRWALQRDKHGEPVAILEINNDVTARKQAEELRRQRCDWLDVTLSSLGDAVITADADGHITFMNAVATALTGWPEAEARGRALEEVFRLVNEHTRQAVESPTATVLRDGTPATLATHTALVTRDGREIPIADSGAPMRNHDGSLRGTVLVFHDIVERQRVEAHLRQMQKMETIGTLAGGIAHDFNNILTAIQGFTELALFSVPPTSQAWGHLQQIIKAGRRAKDLIQQILAFSRHTRTQREPIALSLVVQETLQFIRAALPSTIVIQAAIAPDAGFVLADATQMHQILLNLCSNAGHAMRYTGGVLHVRLHNVEVEAKHAAAETSLTVGSYVQLTVQDTGHGMTPDVKERIFEPCFTTKGPREGTGMGLAVVHGIVVNHCGTITVSSSVGQGTTFTVYLPRIEATASTESSPPDPPLPGGVGGEECVLFVDDEAALVDLGATALRRLGYDVVACTSSRKALALFRATPQLFDVVITDQTMPHMTGDELAQELRRIRSDTRIILCTGYSHLIDAEKACTLGIAEFLMKPWQGQALASAIRRVLNTATLGSSGSVAAQPQQDLETQGLEAGHPCLDHTRCGA